MSKPEEKKVDAEPIEESELEKVESTTERGKNIAKGAAKGAMKGALAGAAKGAMTGALEGALDAVHKSDAHDAEVKLEKKAQKAKDK
jgi:hypothetical protein